MINKSGHLASIYYYYLLFIIVIIVIIIVIVIVIVIINIIIISSSFIFAEIFTITASFFASDQFNFTTITSGHNKLKLFCVYFCKTHQK